MANETLTTGATRNRQNPTSDDLLNIARLAYQQSGSPGNLETYSGNRASYMKGASDVLAGRGSGNAEFDRLIGQAAEQHFGGQQATPTGAGGTDQTFKMALAPQQQVIEQQTVQQGKTSPQGWGVDASGHMAKVGSPMGIQTPEVQPPTTGIPQQAPVTPTTPQPQAPVVVSSFMQGAQTAIDTTRKTVEDSYKKQLDDIKIQQDAAQKKIDDLNATQQGIIQGDMAKLQAPFRQQLEDAERQRLYINENFEANQKLTNELQTLLTDGNALIKQQQDATSLGAIKNPRLNQTISDVSARAGVLQAVLSARNGQIAQAYTMIDRSVNAINADRQDQLDHFKTLYNFYEGKKGVEQQKLLTLTSDQKKYLDAQIGLLEGDMTRAQKNADDLKKAMTDPDTALTYARAGITLNDTPEQRSQKLAQDSINQSIIKRSQEMNKAGYEYISGPSQLKGLSPNQIYREVGADGKERIYKKPAEKLTEVSPGATLYDPVTKKVIYTAPTIKQLGGTGGGVSTTSIVPTGGVKFSQDENQRLLATGVTPADISYIKDYINKNGITDELRNGVPKATLDILNNILKGVTPTQEQAQKKEEPKFITADYIKKFFTESTLKKLAAEGGYKKGGILGIGASGDVDAYTKALMNQVELYRQQGLSDKDIFTKLSAKIK